MYEIVVKRELAPQINLFEFLAREIAAKTKPGQFVIFRIDECGERVPLTIANANVEKGTVTVACHEVGMSTKKLAELGVGDCILDLLGPLGRPSEIAKFGTVMCVGGGVMIAPLSFQAEALHKSGNEIIGVLGAKTRSQIIFEDNMRDICEELFVATDDGTKGYKGLDFLKNLFEEKKVDRVIVMGPIVTMKTVSDLTLHYKIPTFVNLIPIMVDGMGMCGACRVSVDGETLFACVDGPEFDGHKVDFDELMSRLKMFTPYEKTAHILHEEGKCRL